MELQLPKPKTPQILKGLLAVGNPEQIKALHEYERELAAWEEEEKERAEEEELIGRPR